MDDQRRTAAKRLLRVWSRVESHLGELEQVGVVIRDIPIDGVDEIILDLVGIPRQYQRDPDQQEPVFDPESGEFDRTVYQDMVYDLCRSGRTKFEDSEFDVDAAILMMSEWAMHFQDEGYGDPLEEVLQ